MDRKDINIRSLNFPEPSVPVDDAWKEMNNLLSNDPAVKPHYRPKLINPINILYLFIGFITVVTVLKKIHKKNTRTKSNVTYLFKKSENKKPNITTSYFKDTAFKETYNNSLTSYLSSQTPDLRSNPNINDHLINSKEPLHHGVDHSMIDYSVHPKIYNSVSVNSVPHNNILSTTYQNLSKELGDLHYKKYNNWRWLNVSKTINPNPNKVLKQNNYPIIFPITDHDSAMPINKRSLSKKGKTINSNIRSTENLSEPFFNTIDTSGLVSQLNTRDIQSLELSDSINNLLNKIKRGPSSKKMPDFNFGIQLLSPVPIFNKQYFINQNGKYSPADLLIPQLLIKWNLNSFSGIYSSINLRKNVYVGGSNIYSAKIRRSSVDTFFIQNSLSLVNLTGASLALGYGHSFHNLGYNVGLDYTLTKGALIHIVSKDLMNNTLLQDSVKGIKKNDSLWRYFAPGFLNMQAEVNYSFKRFSIGLQASLPLSSFTSSLSQPIRKTNYSFTLRYWIR